MSPLDRLLQFIGGGNPADTGMAAVGQAPLPTRLVTGGALGEAGQPAGWSQPDYALQALQDWMSGKLEYRGPFGAGYPGTEDERRHDIAMSFVGGPMAATRAAKAAMPRSGKVGSFITARENYVPVEGTPAPSFWDLPERVAAREEGLRSAFPSPNIGKGTDAPLFDLSRLSEHPGVTHNRPQLDLPRFTPARGKPVPDHIMQQLADPEMRKRLEAAFEFGVKNGGPEWLNMMPVLDRFQEIAGPELGAARFNSLAQHIGGTTSGAKPPQNVKMASYWDYLSQHGDPAITRADTLSKDPLTKMVPAQGYGSPTQGLHALNAQRLREGGLRFDSINNPKSASFPENIWGNYRPLMIDEVMSSPKVLNLRDRSGKPISSPEAAGYLPTEQFLQGLAKGHSLDPAQYQASLWVGASPEKVKTYSQPLASVVEDKLRFTAKKRGQTPEEALYELVMAHRPLLSVGAGLGLGTATMGQFDELLQGVEMPR